MNMIEIHKLTRTLNHWIEQLGLANRYTITHDNTGNIVLSDVETEDEQVIDTKDPDTIAKINEALHELGLNITVEMQRSESYGKWVVKQLETAHVVSKRFDTYKEAFDYLVKNNGENFHKQEIFQIGGSTTKMVVKMSFSETLRKLREMR